MTLPLSAGIVDCGGQFRYSSAELYGIGGAAPVALGAAFGFALVATGTRQLTGHRPPAGRYRSN